MLWSQKDINILKKEYIKDDKTINEISIMLNRSKKSICHKASRLNLSRPKPAHNRADRPRQEYDKAYYKNNKTKIKLNYKQRALALKHFYVKQLGGKCSICNYNKCLSALEFHHIEEKDYSISKLIHDESIEKLKTEIKKCVLLCSNCHRELHSSLRDTL